MKNTLKINIMLQNSELTSSDQFFFWMEKNEISKPFKIGIRGDKYAKKKASPLLIE